MDVPNQMQVRKKKKLRKKIEPFLYLLPALLFFVGFTHLQKLFLIVFSWLIRWEKSGSL